MTNKFILNFEFELFTPIETYCTLDRLALDLSSRLVASFVCVSLLVAGVLSVSVLACCSCDKIELNSSWCAIQLSACFMSHPTPVIKEITLTVTFILHSTPVINIITYINKIKN